MRLATPIAAVVLLALAAWALAPAEACFHAGPAAAGELALPAASAGPVQPWEAATLRGGGPDRIALLIGIDDYPDDVEGRFADLSGCVRDVEAVAALLRERFGFEEESILILRNEEATHEAIVRAFRDWLIERATSESEVVFWYSGHGSRVPDTSGLKDAESGGLDSTLLAWDSRRGGLDGAYDLTDDELHSLLAALGRVTPNVLAVTDSCHSAAVFRGSEEPPKTRGTRDKGTQPFEPERVRDFWPEDVELLDDTDPWKRALPAGYVHVAACRQDQEAHEIPASTPAGEPQTHGALSFFLTEVLKEARPGTSFRRVADEAAQRLAAHVSNQSVCYEGAVDRELLGSRFEAPPPGFVARASAGASIQVQAGRLHGLRAGSRLAVSSNLGGDPLGTATVVLLGSISAEARWDEPPAAELAPGAALRAVETSRPAGQDPLRVHARDDALAALLAADDFATVVRDEQGPAEYELVREPDGAAALYAPGDLRIWLRSPAELRDEAATGAALHEALGAELKYRSLCNLASFEGELQLEARFRPPTEAELKSFGSETRQVGDALRWAGEDELAAAGDELAAAGNEQIARGGESMERLNLAFLDVVNRSDVAVYVAVLSATEDRACNPIHPHPREPHPGVLEPGQKRSIPVGVLTNPEWKLERPMRDRYVVVACKSTQVDFESFETGSRLRSASSGTVPDVLEAAFDLPLTRGGRRAPRGRDGADLGVTVVDLLVE